MKCYYFLKNQKTATEDAPDAATTHEGTAICAVCAKAGPGKCVPDELRGVRAPRVTWI